MATTFERIMTKNECYRVASPMKPKGCMIHSTGANNPNVSRYVHDMSGSSSMNWNRSGLTKCVHGFIGKYQDYVVYCHTLPYTMRGWHAGGTANASYIGIEICEDSLTDETYLKQCLDACSDVFAEVCLEYGLDPKQDGVIISHHEGYLRSLATNHADIDHWLKRFNITMDDFRGMVVGKVEALKNKTPQDSTSQSPEPGGPKWYEEDVAWCVAMGLMNGKDPEGTVTRAQLATVLHRFYDKMRGV